MPLVRQLTRATDGVQRRIRRWWRSPFPSEADPQLLVHACHHKAGTVWFRNVLGDVARHYGLRFDQASHRRKPEPGTGIFLQDHSKLDLDDLPTFRGSHVVRDPRDIVVSAYHYHLWTDEAWAHVPRDRFGGRSYQQRLRSLPQDEGLLLEIEHTAFTIEDMRRWSFDDPRFLEIRFEDLLADELPTFERIFRHYGFHEEAVAIGLERSNVTRTPGRRSGSPGTVPHTSARVADGVSGANCSTSATTRACPSCAGTC